MTFHVVIPARYDASRLPGKPLKLIAGKPMVQWVYQAAQASSAASVVVATDDQRVADAVTAFGGQVCMTSAQHPSGTDRLQEAVVLMGLSDQDIVVNVQGDEPLMPPEVIEQVAANLADHPQTGVATLSEPLNSLDECFDPNVVKVVSDHRGLALYFSRAPIPWLRDNYVLEPAARAQSSLPPDQLAQRHLGLYAYRVALLHRFITWPPAPLELAEKLEQLRVLANGVAIHVAPACASVPGGVDTPADLARIKQLLE